MSSKNVVCNPFALHRFFEAKTSNLIVVPASRQRKKLISPKLLLDVSKFQTRNTGAKCYRNFILTASGRSKASLRCKFDGEIDFKSGAGSSNANYTDHFSRDLVASDCVQKHTSCGHSIKWWFGGRPFAISSYRCFWAKNFSYAADDICARTGFCADGR